MGTIVFCKYHQDTLEQIAEWCDDNKVPFPTGKSKIHTSVVWSVTDVPQEHWIQRDASHFRKMEFKATGLEVFPHWSKRFDEMKACLVITLDAPYLTHCNKHMARFGAVGKYDFVPHITVSYNFPEGQDISGLTVPKFAFKPNKIFTEHFIPPKTQKS